MSKKEWVDDNHYRETSDDGRRSYLWESNGWSSNLEEVAEHHKDGTTDAYEADNSIIGSVFHGSKGNHK